MGNGDSAFPFFFFFFFFFDIASVCPGLAADASSMMDLAEVMESTSLLKNSIISSCSDWDLLSLTYLS